MDRIRGALPALHLVFYLSSAPRRWEAVLPHPFIHDQRHRLHCVPSNGEWVRIRVCSRRHYRIPPVLLRPVRRLGVDHSADAPGPCLPGKCLEGCHAHAPVLRFLHDCCRSDRWTHWQPRRRELGVLVLWLPFFTCPSRTTSPLAFPAMAAEKLLPASSERRES